MILSFADCCQLEKLLARSFDRSIFYPLAITRVCGRTLRDVVSIAISRCNVARPAGKNDDDARRGLKTRRDRGCERMSKYICSHVRTFVPSLGFSRVFLPPLRHETHTPSRATHISSFRSISRDRFEGQMALKSVYNSSRNSAPGGGFKREREGEETGCDTRRELVTRNRERTRARGSG